MGMLSCNAAFLHGESPGQRSYTLSCETDRLKVIKSDRQMLNAAQKTDTPESVP
jgi:hypothetical protein